jgi:WD40 repeat protein
LNRNGGVLQTLDIHTDEITDCVEIANPQCIATCSLDRSIVLFDVEHREHLRTISDGHEKGIRHLRYQSTNGTQMISIGSEAYANVWAPESLVSDVHIGSLKGHKKGIVDGNYLKMAPYFVTIDESNQVNFWDIQTLICIQVIPSSLQTSCEGLVVLTNNIFWIFGRRFIQYDTFSIDDEDAQGGSSNDGDFPIAV